MNLSDPDVNALVQLKKIIDMEGNHKFQHRDDTETEVSIFLAKVMYHYIFKIRNDIKVTLCDYILESQNHFQDFRNFVKDLL